MKQLKTKLEILRANMVLARAPNRDPHHFSKLNIKAHLAMVQDIAKTFADSESVRDMRDFYASKDSKP